MSSSLSDKWNYEFTRKQRKALLTEAGYSATCYAARVFSFIPRSIRDDLIYAYQRLNKGA